jgi:hypothetical protein
MRRILVGLAALAASFGIIGSVSAAPFAVVSFHKGQSALVYDTSTLEREGPYLRAWVYLIVSTPMDGATMVAYRREFVCGVRQSRDIARRFVDANGQTVRAVEVPGEWQFLGADTDDMALLDMACGNRPSGPVMGKGLSVFDYHDVVQTALAKTALTRTASR